MPSVRLICMQEAGYDKFLQRMKRWQLDSNPCATLALVFTPERLELRKLDEPKMGAVYVDFVSGALAHRRRFGGGEALLRALGLAKERYPQVVDATAGLGRDAFVMAAAGCHVQMVERHPVVAALLEDGLLRAYEDPAIGFWLRRRLTLLHGSSLSLLTELAEKPEVIYLDPMFPHRQKSALVKKEMRILQQLVGADQDASQLLLPARQAATRRVVVKRPGYAPPLAGITPQAAVPTKNHRFDIYMPLESVQE